MTAGGYKSERGYERGLVYVNERTGWWVRESGSVYDRKQMRVPVGSRGFVRVSTCEWFSVGELRECVRVRVRERAILCNMRSESICVGESVNMWERAGLGEEELCHE